MVLPGLVCVMHPGTIEKERSGKLEVKEEKDGNAKVKKGGDKVETKTPNPPAPEGTTGTDVIKLRVQSIRSIAASCPAQ